MRTLVITLLVLAALGGAGAAAWQPASYYWQLRNVPKWRTAEMAEGNVVSVVNSTGTVKPVLQIAIGAFVSGPIEKLHVEFNQEVKKDDLLAEIDPRIYEAAVARDRATLATRRADVERAEAQLQQAVNDEQRALDLRREDPAFIAQAELDKVKFNRMALAAQVKVAETSIDQALAQLDNSLLNLGYTKIRSPVDGIVIDRKIDPGQTLAAQFQTPELFIIAPDMREKMHVHASVDEADIGLIKEAQDRKLPVTFTVDAYPEELFTGTIEEIRLSSTTTQNVVTYPVIVAAPNADLRLLPGMTASISFEVARSMNVVKIPNSALRFFPQANHVRTQDKPLLEGKAKEMTPDPDEVQETGLSAVERADARRTRNLRHVWVVDGLKLRAVEVVVGLSESRFTELVSGKLKVGDKLVTGIDQPQNWGG
ncbi:MAG: efflux RND transporter periplasmic adaptor subunit [Pirellulaceae bacterium]